MLPLLVILLLTTVVNTTQLGERLNQNNTVRDKLLRYMNRLKLGDSTLILLIDLQEEQCKDYTDLFLYKFVRYPNIIDSGEMSENLHIPVPRYTFVFVEKHVHIKDFLKRSDNFTYYNVRSKFHFIICAKVNRTKWVKPLLKYIWNRGLFNYVFVYVTDTLNVLSYNGFLDEKIMNLTSKRKISKVLFPNKMKNLMGKELTVGVYEEYPKVRKEHGQWRGEDIKILREIIRSVNATLKIKELPPPKNKFDISDVFGTNKDFRFVRRSLHSAYDGLVYVQPFKLDNLLAVVPLSQTKTSTITSFFAMYTFESVMVILLLLITVASIAKLSGDMSFILAAYWASYLFGTFLKNFRRNSNSTKIVFLSWTIFGLLNGVIFQTTITAMLLRKKHHQEIDTIEKLHQSNLTIYIDTGHFNLVPAILRAQCVFANSTEIHGKFMNDSSGSNVYILLESTINAIERQMRSKLSTFRIMKEVVIPGFTVYLFKKDSPWFEMVDNSFRSLFDIVYLNRYQFTVKRRHGRHEKHPELSTRSLTFQNWKSIFSAILVCHSIAFIVFIAEVLWNRIMVFCQRIWRIFRAHRLFY